MEHGGHGPEHRSERMGMHDTWVGRAIADAAKIGILGLGIFAFGSAMLPAQLVLPGYMKGLLSLGSAWWLNKKMGGSKRAAHAASH